MLRFEVQLEIIPVIHEHWTKLRAHFALKMLLYPKNAKAFRSELNNLSKADLFFIPAFPPIFHKKFQLPFLYWYCGFHFVCNIAQQSEASVVHGYHWTYLQPHKGAVRLTEWRGYFVGTWKRYNFQLFVCVHKDERMDTEDLLLPLDWRSLTGRCSHKERAHLCNGQSWRWITGPGAPIFLTFHEGFLSVHKIAKALDSSNDKLPCQVWAFTKFEELALCSQFVRPVWTTPWHERKILGQIRKRNLVWCRIQPVKVKCCSRFKKKPGKFDKNLFGLGKTARKRQVWTQQRIPTKDHKKRVILRVNFCI